MSASINKVILIGNLGQAPELRYTTNNTAVATLSIATHESWKDKDGHRQERTQWHRVVVFGRLAEHCNDYLSKGRSVYIEGRLETNKWEDQDGQTRYTTQVIAKTVQFLGQAPQSNTSDSNDEMHAFGDEDIPFQSITLKP